MKQKKLLTRSHPEIRITAIYLAMGILWITLSDKYLSDTIFNNVQTLKGIFFIIVTASILFVFIRRESKKQYRIRQQILSKEEEFKHLIENQSDLLVKIDASGKFLYVNKSYCNYFEKTRKELIGTNFMPLVHEDDRHATTRAMESLYTPPHKANVTQRVLCRGDWRWMEWKDAAILDENDKVVEIIGIGRDITERINTENELKESEEKYRRLFEKSKDPILILQDGLFMDCNQATVDLLGYNNKSDILGKNPWNLSPQHQPDGSSSKNKAEILVKQALKNGYERFEWVHLNKENKEIFIEVALTTIKHKGKDILYTVWRDITKRKKVEKALQISQDNFKLIAENTSDFILILDKNFNIKYVSPSVSNVLGFSDNELYLKSVFDFVHPEDVLTAKKRVLMERENSVKSSTFQNRAIKKDGTALWIELSIERIYDAKKTIEYSVCIGRDITERKKHVKELQIALDKARESDQLKSAFLANMSHEIRTPLNGILGFSEILATDDELDKESRVSYSDIIKRSGNQLLNILNDILDISRIESMQVVLDIAPVDISKVLMEIYSNFEVEMKKKELEFFIEIPDDIEKITLFGDTQKVFQVFTNLLTNAMKFTPKGSITMGLKSINGVYTFFVKDTGIGIKEEHKNKIFDRFMQVKDINQPQTGGTGLGLSISRSLVNLMGGKIWVESEPGAGSTFFFTLPNKKTITKEHL